MSPIPDDPRLQHYRDQFTLVDTAVTQWMNQWSIPVLRFALAVVFIWFGALKVTRDSPAEGLVAETVVFLPPDLFVPILGIWEVLIGVCMLYRPLIRLGIALLFLQLPGTFLPIVLLPDVVFASFPYSLTVHGQYIIKNLVIIGAALAIGSTLRDDTWQKEPPNQRSAD